MADEHQQSLSPPPLPRAVRISRRALWAIVAVVAGTVFGASLALQKTADVTEQPQQAPAPPLRSAAPSFLDRQPLPPRGAGAEAAPVPLATPEELRRAQEAGFIDDYLPVPPDGAPASFPPTDPRMGSRTAGPEEDPRAEAFRRALAAPSLVEPSATRGPGPASAPSGLAADLGLDGHALALPPLPSAREFLAAAQGVTPPAPRVAEPAAVPELAASPHRVVFAPPARHVLPAGSTIPAVLETGLHSDLPGDLSALVTLDVYDRTRREVLVPRGSRLLGSYENRVAAGQNRLVVAWTRLVLPDGRGLAFPGLAGVSPGGEAGLRGRVDSHLASVFGHAVLLSLVSAGAQLGQPQESSTFGQAASARQVAAGALANELSTVATELLRRGLHVPPTITVPPGTTFHVYVAYDLVFPERSRS